MDTEEGFIDLAGAGSRHKYLRRAFLGNLRARGQAALDHWISCAWARFRSLEPTFTSKQINIKLRLKLFCAVVTPTMLYTLDTSPLTHQQLGRLGVTQNKMMRKMVGWICESDESWEEMGAPNETTSTVSSVPPSCAFMVSRSRTAQASAPHKVTDK